MKKKVKCSSGAISKEHCKYLKGIPDGERITSKIVRSKEKYARTPVKWVQIFIGGVLTFSNKPDEKTGLNMA